MGNQESGSIPGRDTAFIFSREPTPALRPNQPPTQEVPGISSRGVKGLDVSLIADLRVYLVAVMRGITPPLPNTYSWHGR